MAFFRKFAFPRPSLDAKTAPGELLAESLYLFLLSDNFWAWLAGLFAVGMQIIVLGFFLYYRDDDETWCAAECVVSDTDTSQFEFFEPQFDKSTDFGRFFMFLILFTFTYPDITKGLQLMYKAVSMNTPTKLAWWDYIPPFWPISPMIKAGAFGKCPWTADQFRLFVAGFLISLIAIASLWIAGIYTWSTGLSNTDLLMNIVGILYILDVDEAAYGLLKGIFPVWQDQVFKDIGSIYEEYGKAHDSKAEEPED